MSDFLFQISDSLPLMRAAVFQTPSLPCLLPIEAAPTVCLPITP